MVFTVNDYKIYSKTWNNIWNQFENTFIDLVWTTRDNKYIRIDLKKIKGIVNKKFGTGVDDRIFKLQNNTNLIIPVPKGAENLYVDFFTIKKNL